MPAETPALADLHATLEAIALGRTSCGAELEKCIERAQSAACTDVFVGLDAQGARDTLSSLDARGEGIQRGALGGLAVGIKDLYDIAGQQTLSGSPALDHLPAAAQDAPAVARLRAAGGIVLGRTAQNQFAFSGMGLNPHFGTPRNATDHELHRLPGGSSSGAAVAVATGAVFLALGSDTGGSVRIPAAMNGIVGFKPSTDLIPTTGAVPLSTTLDTVGPLARSVRDVALGFSVLAQRRLRLRPGLRGLRIGVPTTLMLDGLDAEVSNAFERTLASLSKQGAQVETFALPELSQVAGLQTKAGFSSIEGLAWHRRAGSWQRQNDIDPRVLTRMGVAQNSLAVDYVDLLEARRAWIARCERACAGFDILASPTVPITARALADVADNLEAFMAVNAQMLRNTAPVNFLGGPGISVPIQAPGSLGIGLMLWALPHADEALLSAAQAAEQVLQK